MSACKVFLRSASSCHTNNILQAYEILCYCSKTIITTLPYLIAFIFLNAERSINSFTLRTYFSFLTRTAPIWPIHLQVIECVFYWPLYSKSHLFIFLFGTLNYRTYMSYWFYLRSMANDVNNVKSHFAKTKQKKLVA